MIFGAIHSYPTNRINHIVPLQFWLFERIMLWMASIRSDITSWISSYMLQWRISLFHSIWSKCTWIFECLEHSILILFLIFDSQSSEKIVSLRTELRLHIFLLWLLRITGDAAAAVLGGLLFALHPVSNITSRICSLIAEIESFLYEYLVRLKSWESYKQLRVGFQATDNLIYRYFDHLKRFLREKVVKYAVEWHIPWRKNIYICISLLHNSAFSSRADTLRGCQFRCWTRRHLVQFDFCLGFSHFASQPSKSS